MCERHVCKHCNVLLDYTPPDAHESFDSFNDYSDDSDDSDDSSDDEASNLDGSTESSSCEAESSNDTQQSRHVCNPDDVATFQALSQNTKPCPKCHVLIYKIDGCDQMWCTQCHVAFSWLQTRIHNPHYFEWMRQNNRVIPRDPLDIPPNQNNCLEWTDITNELIITGCNDLRESNSITEQVSNNILNIIRNREHLEVQFQRIENTIVNGVKFNEDNRVKYMLKELSDKEFQAKTLSRYNARDKNRAVCDIARLQHTILGDLLLRVLNHIQMHHNDNTIVVINDKLSDIYNEMKNLTEFTNSLLVQHARTYNCKKYKLYLTTRQENTNDVLARE